MPSTTSRKTSQTVRLDDRLNRAVLHYLADSGESFQAFVVRLIERELNAGNPAPHPESRHGEAMVPAAEVRRMLKEIEARILKRTGEDRTIEMPREVVK